MSANHQPGQPARIPRQIHQIWVGGKPLPAKFAAWADGFRTRHPSWGYQLWNDAAIEALIHENFPAHEAVYSRIQKLAQKADLARYMILAVHGGAYLDTDCECRRPFDFIADSDELVVAPELQTTSRKVKELYRTTREELYCTWAFLARPGHPFLTDLVEEVARRVQRRLSDDPVVNVVDQTGPGVFTDVLRGYLSAGGAARIVPGPWFGCPDGSSLFRFSRSFMFPELFRTVYLRHHAELSWLDPREKRRWMIRSAFFLSPAEPKPRSQQKENLG